MLELMIKTEKDIETICLVENGKLIEVYVNDSKTKKNRLEGNIYLAKVTDVICGMQAAFVDFGENKKGFIHLKDAIPQIDETKQKTKKLPDIRDVLKTGQTILVQVKKDSNDKKGARVSTHISLPSKYIVLMPNTDFITISQKIDDDNKKQELKKCIKSSLPKGFGAIVRTSAITASEEDIKKDINIVLTKWKSMEDKVNKNANKLALIAESEGIAQKILLDINDIDKIITNDEKQYKEIEHYLQVLNNTKTKLELLKEDLLNIYELNSQIEKLQNRKIWLNCGGFITIDKTEALTAVDVNTGKFTGKNDLESTIFKVNKEATIELAKQLRLRDIGGIIIIDYIDMKNEENKQKVQELLKDCLKKDRAKTQVEGFTKLNLMEMTRKHICSHLDD